MLAIAVWGSLLASFILGVFMSAQVWLDTQRRSTYVSFSICWFSLAILDASLTSLGPYYEPLRVLWCSFYIGCLLNLFGRPHRVTFWGLTLLPLFGFITFLFGVQVYATTFSFVTAFSIATFFHIKAYWQHKGYASAMLSAFTLAQAILCLTYVPVLESGNPNAMTSGYFHFTFINLLSVLLGWIHLPREISGKLPVKIEPRLAISHFALIVGVEIFIYVVLIHPFPQLIFWVTVLSMAMLATSSWIFFVHRHRLVIHTDNVEQLLKERTSSLQEAQLELSLQNQNQAMLLHEQAQELNAKADIIGRQKRLELAGQTAGGVAHDLANFIHILDSHLLKTEVHLRKKKVLDDVQHHFDTVKRQVNRLYELNQQLLSLSRRGSTQSEWIEVKDLCSEVKEMLKDNPLTLSYSDHGMMVLGNRSQLLRAITNLCINAFEADPSQRVTLEVGVQDTKALKECHLGYLSPGESIAFKVTDHGPGIRSEHLDHIFEPFFSSKMDEQNKSGTGLGLTIVAGIIDDHKGTIDVQNNQEGCTFTIFLPKHTVNGQPLLQNETHLVSLCNNSINEQMVSDLKNNGVITHAFDTHQLALADEKSSQAKGLIFLADQLSESELLHWLHLSPEITFIQVSSSSLTSCSSLVDSRNILSNPVQIDHVLSILRNAQN